MATTESASASLGPRYAPEDPTLPKPWKGLIDGSTSLLYYWNPETNVTQYERPAALPPPLPQGPPPAAGTPKLAPLPMARPLQPNGVVAQQVQQLSQQQGVPMPQQQGQQMLHQQQGQQMPQQQQGQQMSQQQQGQQMPQQQQGNQMASQQQGQQLPRQQQGQQLPNQPLGQQMPQQQGHQMTHHLGQQFSHQQLQQVPYPQGQQNAHTQGQQIPQHQAQQTVPQQGQPVLLQQGQQFGFPQRDEIGFQQGKPTGFSSPQLQQAGFSSIHNIPPGTYPVHAPMGFNSVHSQQTATSSMNVPPTGGSFMQAQQTGLDSIHQRQISGPMVQNMSGLPMIRNQQAGGPPMGLKMGYEDDKHGRPGNEFYFNGNRERGMVIPEQSSLAAVPPAHNQQEMRMGAVHPQNVTPGLVSGLNIAGGHARPNMYNHSAGGQAFSNNAPMRPSPRILGSSELSNLSAADVYRQQHEVTASGDNVPPPFMTFEATGFPPEILREIQVAGFSSPTPIQAQTWPVALQSRDIVAIAKTGSGKTLGYLLPAFVHLRRCQNNPQVGPTVLVLAPTRELATQIQDEAIKFGRSLRNTCTCLYGGAPKGPQLREIEQGVDIVVATPGRLNDILEMKKINLRQVSFLVLDEADRMLDMGFEPQIRKIVNEIPPQRQTLMYTATWPKEVRKIAGDLLLNPVQVNIGSVDELAANKSITQYVEVVPQMEKQRRLEQILRSQERGSKIIIFCSTKRLCDQLARSIGRSFGAAAIHGDKTQDERDWVLNQFRSGKSPILVATDVAARGLDIKDIRVVINYDFPTGIEDYVHRIGRTGRAGATGLSYTFFSDQDWKYAADLVKVLEGANQRVPPEVREMAARGGPGFNRGGRGGMSRWDSGGGRWDSGGRGGRDGGFGGRGGRDNDFSGRDGGFGGRGGRDGGFGGRGGRDVGFGGRGGRDGGFGGRGGGRDGGFGGRGGRGDFFGGRGNRGRGFGGAGGRGRHDRGPRDRYDSVDGRGRYDNRRGFREQNRGRSYSRSYSPSPDRVRTWDYKRSRSRSQSRSPSRSRSWTHSRSRSRSRSYDRYDRPQGQEYVRNPRPSGFGGPPTSQMSPMSPGPHVESAQVQVAEKPTPSEIESSAEPSQLPVVDP